MALAAINAARRLQSVAVMEAIAGAGNGVYFYHRNFNRAMVVVHSDRSRIDEDYASRISLAIIAANSPRLPAILRTMGLEFIDWRQWGIIWVAAQSWRRCDSADLIGGRPGCCGRWDYCS